MRQLCVYAFFFGLGICALPAQVFHMSGAPIFSCSGQFFDAGGSTADYPNNQSLHTTICPDGMGLPRILLRFDTIALAAGDTLCFLDGSSVLAPRIGCHYDFPAGQPFVVQASASNGGGCLTVTFSSDSQATAAGWAAKIECVACVLPAPTQVQVVDMRNGFMHWQWDSVPGSAGFEVSVNGSAWEPSSEPLGHVVSGLAPGDLVILEVRPISPNPECTVLSVSVNKIYVECTLTLSLVSVVDVRCAGTSTGSAVMVANGAIGPVQFFVVGDPQPFPSGNFADFFIAGDYQVAVHDSVGCRDTVAFRIEEPPPIVVQTAAADARCFADDSGSLSASASGGVGGFTYRWQRCQGGPVLMGAQVANLYAGCYAVTVQDANGCTAVAQDTISEPPPFAFSSSQDSVRCHGSADGRATISTSGATPPYTFQWSNGDTGPVADSLKAGFHSVTVTDATGCQAVTLVQVLQPPLLRFDSLQAIGVSCFGASDGLVSALAMGGSPPLAYAWSHQQQAGPVLTGVPAGTYTVTVSDQKGCTAAGAIEVPSPAPLAAQKAVKDETCTGLCDGAITLALSGGTPPYAISWTDISIPPGQTSPQSLCPGVYGFVLSDSRNCTTSDAAVVVAAVPLVTTFTITPPRCAGGTDGSVQADVQGGAPPYQYQWNNGSADSTLANIPCGDYALTVSDSFGCTQVSTAAVPCPEPLVIDSIHGTPAACFGGANGSAAVFARGGTGGLAFLWNDANQQVAAVAVNLLAGTYTVTVSDANGCSATASVSIGQPPALQATLFAQPVTCLGNNDGAAWAVVSGGTPPYIYLWSNQRTDSLLTLLPPGLYALTITDANGCTLVPLPVVVAEPSSPLQVSAVAVQQACFNGGGGVARAIASGGSGPPYTYLWSNQANTAEAGGLSAGIYTVTATDASGCSAVQSVAVGRWDSIVVSIAIIAPTCPNDRNGQASINKLEGGAGNGLRENYKLQWNVPDAGDTIYLSGLASGQLLVLTVTDNAGCTATFERRVDSLLPIVPVLTVDSISCFGQNNGRIRVVGVQSSRPITGYLWNTGATGPNLTTLPAGSYTVTVTDTQGCSGTAAATLSEPPPLNLTLQVDSIPCIGDTNGRIRALASGGTPPYTFNWNTAANTDRLENLGPGTYTITLTDQKACTRTAEAILQPPEPLTITLDLTPPTCFGYRNGRAIILVEGGPPPLRYRLQTATFGDSPAFLGLAAGQYAAAVLDGKGCITEITFELGQPLPVQVSITPSDTTLVFGDSLQLQADVANAIGGATFSWQSALADTLRCADPPECTAIWVTPPYSNTYTALATDANGCSGSATAQVRVEKPRGVYVPSAFSPNSDGNNDRLFVHGKSRQIKRIRLFQIFDRWGELVFEARDLLPNDDSQSWDGTFRGQPAQTGTYVWHVEVEYRDGYEERLHGHVLLVR